MDKQQQQERSVTWSQHFSAHPGVEPVSLGSGSPEETCGLVGPVKPWLGGLAALDQPENVWLTGV